MSSAIMRSNTAAGVGPRQPSSRVGSSSCIVRTINENPGGLELRESFLIDVLFKKPRRPTFPQQTARNQGADEMHKFGADECAVASFLISMKVFVGDVAAQQQFNPGAVRMNAPDRFCQAARVKRPPKYQNPAGDETWTGQSKKPKWFEAALVAGITEEEMLIKPAA